MARTKTTKRRPKLTRTTHRRLLTTDYEQTQVMKLAHLDAIQQSRERSEDEDEATDEGLVWIDYCSWPIGKRICITEREHGIYCKIGNAWRTNKGSRYVNKNGFAAYPYKTMYFRTIT